jgi:hypothetical protein
MLVPGDANRDSKVDVSDLGILAANYGQVITASTGDSWAYGDFNADGKVDVSDLGILAANYGTGAVRDKSPAGKEEIVPPAQPCGVVGLLIVAGTFLAGLGIKGESGCMNTVKMVYLLKRK